MPFSGRMDDQLIASARPKPHTGDHEAPAKIRSRETGEGFAAHLVFSLTAAEAARVGERKIRMPEIVARA